MLNSKLVLVSAFEALLMSPMHICMTAYSHVHLDNSQAFNTESWILDHTCLSSLSPSILPPMISPCLKPCYLEISLMTDSLSQPSSHWVGLFRHLAVHQICLPLLLPILILPDPASTNVFHMTTVSSQFVSSHPPLCSNSLSTKKLEWFWGWKKPEIWSNQLPALAFHWFQDSVEHFVWIKF